MLPSETMIWQPEFTDKTLSRKPGAVQNDSTALLFSGGRYPLKYPFILMIILMFRFSAWRVQILW
ncbi:hypothetical protein HLP45_000632 [Shigella sonnei]|nr:hypothetical protein [Shigella sonnei]